MIKLLKEKIFNGEHITKEDALELYNQPLEHLCTTANEIRKRFCGDGFDICTIVNGKSGRCSEDCKYCAQSSFYDTRVETYPLLSTDELMRQAKYNDQRGVLRYSIVTSGKALSDSEVDQICESVDEILKETNISVCASLGLLNEEQFVKLKHSGVSRVHNNLETSRRNFPNICTTHSYDDKINSIKSAQKAGMNVCSGGIMGLGETIQDRIDMAITLRELGVNSVPLNMLNPIVGTPYEKNEVLTTEEMCRIVAVFRFILPHASIRLAGGRGLLADKGKSCFLSGANATISGDMLTTSGMTIEKDMQMIQNLKFKVVLLNE